MNLRERTLGTCVAIAEEDESLRDELAAALAEEGYEVLPLADAGELYAYLGMCRFEYYAKPDIVVSDVGPDGVSAMDSLRAACGSGLAIPFVLIASSAEKRALREARARGAAVLTKPVPVREVVRVVERLAPVH